MNYMDGVFARADIQQIREFLLHGAEELHVDTHTYEERTERVLKRVMAELKKTYPEQEEYERVSNLVYECVSAFEDVYMEVGLQVGAIVSAQVCQNLKTAYEGE